MAFKYNSVGHVFNIVNKNISKKEITLTENDKDDIKSIIDYFWSIEEDRDSMNIIERNNAYNPVGTITWFLFEGEYKDSRGYINILQKLKLEYERLLRRGELRESKLILKSSTFNVFKEKYLNKSNLCSDFIERLEDIKNIHGVYFLYNRNKELVYVGKSFHLGERLLSSIEERGAYFYEYVETNTRSDMSIYEVYYIATLKPRLNEESKHADDLTIKINCIRNHKLYRVFK